ncbi:MULTISPECIES: adventurous gliding motility TPR repeat lipoprotein GltE [Anaeromyxobacter]|uniref:adventurous gliding motility TPR repeat lipoprotein GltE n=1 Tax=Anaeromyxobacter TaxID=161492 RepID=UPI001F5A8732|nr:MULTISPECIES: adventurous gliding motility TPR repeat lipoprotein GltE [unclassified Anaeromyxobacter]
MTTTRRVLPAILLAGAIGCAGSRPRPTDAHQGGGRASTSTTSAAPAAGGDTGGARSERLFAEALKAQEDQRKLGVPTDWAHLERKWRAVLDEQEIPEARYNLGVALEGQGDASGARAAYERALAAKPSLRQAAVNLGVLLEKQGDAPGALAVYARVVHDFPEDAIARARLAALYRASGQLDEAWRLAREALLRDSSSVGANKVLARVALQRNELELANLISLRAQKLDPKDPELPWVSGQVLARQGDDAGAAAQYRKALTLSADYLPARYALLEAATRKQAWAAVAEHAAAILRVEPKNAPVHLALGVARRHLGKPDEALASYAEAEKLAGETLPEVHLARGVLYMRVKNECQPAIDAFRAYARAAGPVAATDSAAPRLERECMQILEENRRATEAAKQMQLDAERKAAEEAAKKAGQGAAKPAGAQAPAPEGAGAATTSTQVPAR